LKAGQEDVRIHDFNFVDDITKIAHNERTPYYTCRAGNKSAYQRGVSPTTTKVSQWQACRRAGGVVKIWRHANPSPYGSFVFQITCDGEIYQDYKTRAASYTAIHATGVLVASGLIILSVISLAARLHLLRHHRTTPASQGEEARV
jgi:hypothetical protein